MNERDRIVTLAANAPKEPPYWFEPDMGGEERPELPEPPHISPSARVAISKWMSARGWEQGGPSLEDFASGEGLSLTDEDRLQLNEEDWEAATREAVVEQADYDERYQRSKMLQWPGVWATGVYTYLDLMLRGSE